MHATANSPHERDASISWLRVKCLEGTAGVDPYDQAVMIVEVDSPDRAWRLEHVGEVITSHPWVRPNLSTCVRVRCLLAPDVRLALGLDGPCPPVLRDVPLASRSLRASAAIREYDKARGKTS